MPRRLHMEGDDKNGLKRGLERTGRNHINMSGAVGIQPSYIAEPRVDGEFDSRACLISPCRSSSRTVKPYNCMISHR